MVSTPSVPSAQEQFQQQMMLQQQQEAAQKAASEQREKDAKATAMQQAVESERSRMGRAQTVLTEGNTSMAQTARKTLLGE